MKCSEARQLTDRRLDRAAEDATFDWAPLEAHLASCAKCAADWRELTRTNEMLSGLRDVGPSNEELETMWQAIATAPPGGTTFLPSISRGVVWRFLAASTTVAACLAGAFLLGQLKYGSMPTRPTAVDKKADARAIQPEVNNSAAFGNFAAGGGAISLGIQEQRARSELLRRYMSPSSDVTLGANVDFLGTHEELGRVTYGYGIPAETSPSESTNETDSLAIASNVGNAEAEGIRSTIERVNETSRGAAVVGKKIEAKGTPASQEASFGEALALRQEVSDRAEERKIRIGLGDDVDGDSLDDKLAQNGSPVSGAAIVQSGASRNDDYFGRSQTTEGVEVGYAVAPASSAGNWFFAESNDGGTGVRQERYAAAGESATPPPPPPGDRAAGEELNARVRGEPATTPPIEATTAPALPSSLKIIKTGELTLEVEAYAEAATRVAQVASDHGAFIADASTAEQTGGALQGTLVIRVTPPRFDALYAALKQLGRLEAESAKAADVTAQYVDIEARLKSLTLAEDRLQELIKTKSFIDRMSSLLEVERELTRVRSEIEQYEGQLRVLANRVSLSTITLHLHEPARIVPGAALAVEVPVLDEAVAALNAMLVEFEGRLVSGKIEKSRSGALTGKYSLRVSLANFGAVLESIAALGRVERRDVKDWQARDVAAAWAPKANCDITLTLHERDPQLPRGEIAVEVPDLAAAMAQLDTLRAETGAMLATSDVTRREDGSSTAQITLRVPAGVFADLVAKLSAIGRTTQKQTSGAVGGVVGGAADVPCDLVLTLAEPVRQVPSGDMTIAVDRFAAAREALSKLVADHHVQVLSAASVQRTDGTWMGRFRLGIPAGDMDDVVARLETIGRVASRQIAGTGLGNLAPTAPGTIAVIDLLLGEKQALSPAPDQTSGSLRQRVRDGLAGLYASLGLIVYGLVMLAPWLVLTLVAGWLIARAWRRRRTLVTADVPKGKKL